MAEDYMQGRRGIPSTRTMTPMRKSSPPPPPPPRPGLRKNHQRTAQRRKLEQSLPPRGMPYISPIIKEHKTIGGEVFNAEGMGSGRKVVWQDQQSASKRATLIRNAGHHARVIPVKNGGFTVYIGAGRKDMENPLERFNYDWTQATGDPKQYGL